MLGLSRRRVRRAGTVPRRPGKLGAAGVEQIIEVKLEADEQAALMKSAAAVKELVDVIKM